MKEILYNDDTELKDLTVGQLRDIIVETLSLMRFEPEKHTYVYSYGYYKPDKPNYPSTLEPYCGLTTDKEV